MNKNKILYVSSEIVPYLAGSTMAERCRTLAQAMQEYGGEIRTFMPRWGVINERRNQLHEVIRLSGMNLIIEGNDHQLIIKVASIPSARVQVYFIDNDDYFHRKATLVDADGNFFADNDQRAIFFARGVLETVKKLQWAPEVVHSHGWFAAVVPVFLKRAFADDPVFRSSKIVVSLYNDPFPFVFEDPAYENLQKLVIDYADGVVVEEPLDDPTWIDYARKAGKPLLENAEDMNAYRAFYDEIL